MKHLNNPDYRRVLECIGELYRQDDLNRLKEHLPGIVAKLVPSSMIWLVGFSPQRRDYPKIHSTYPKETGFDFAPEAVEVIYQDHPCIQHIARTRCVDTIKITDFMSSRQYRQSRLYAEGLGQYRVEYNIGFQILEPTVAEVTSVCFARDRCDFSEAERLMLDLLRPHVGRAYAHAMQMAALREEAALTSDALAATTQAVVAVKADGTAALCTDAARNCLTRYFGGERATSDCLPLELRRWMTRQELPGAKSGQIPAPRQPFSTQRDGRRLTVHLLTGRTTNYRLLLLEEIRVQFSAEPLQRHFGLSARRAEVLLWMAQGKTSAEIATILGLSVSTIHKHSERIFEKLGVESRTAAALQAAEVMSRA